MASSYKKNIRKWLEKQSLKNTGGCWVGLKTIIHSAPSKRIRKDVYLFYELQVRTVGTKPFPFWDGH